MKQPSRKTELLEVAAQLFKDRGFAAVTMRDIAGQMAIKASSLYNHISGKQELLEALVLPVAQAYMDGMTAVYGKEQSSLEKITFLIEHQIDITLDYSGAIAMVNNDWMHLEGQSLVQFESMRNEYEQKFREIIQEGIAQGEFQPVHPEVILFSILSTLRNLYLWYEKRGKLEVNVLKKDMVKVLVKGFV